VGGEQEGEGRTVPAVPAAVVATCAVARRESWGILPRCLMNCFWYFCLQKEKVLSVLTIKEVRKCNICFVKSSLSMDNYVMPLDVE
jgi:hypothetical protein